jgi:hypothetical protein
MWVKRTEAELAAERRRQRRSRVRAAVLIGAFFLLMVTCLFGWGESARRLRVFVPVGELLSRLPFGVVAGIIVSFVFYKWGSKEQPTMVCPKCEATKYDDGVIDCSCGGRYELMEAMKHVV